MNSNEFQITKNNKIQITHDCGTHPMANPTKPRNKSNHAKLGASELKNPYTNNNIPQSVRA